MKLLICKSCGDIFNLTTIEKFCSCKKSSGKYTDVLNAEIKGNCTPIGFSNSSFIQALKIQEIEDIIEENSNSCCKGMEFTAFIIPRKSTSIKYI